MGKRRRSAFVINHDSGGVDVVVMRCMRRCVVNEDKNLRGVVVYLCDGNGDGDDVGFGLVVTKGMCFFNGVCYGGDS